LAGALDLALVAFFVGLVAFGGAPGAVVDFRAAIAGVLPHRQDRFEAQSVDPAA